MKITALALPLLAVAPCISASVAADAWKWANSVVSSDQVATKGGEMRTMDSWSYVDCGLPSDVVQLKSISVSPDPPVPGKNLTVTVEADVQKKIEDGASADVTVKLGLIKLLQKTFDICEEAKDANATVQCPVEPGTYKVAQTVELPKEIPKAKFSVAVRGYNYDDEDLLCLDLFVDFLRRPGSK